MAFALLIAPRKGDRTLWLIMLSTDLATLTQNSRECQTRDWKEGHRRICGLTKKPVEEPKAPLITPFGPGTEADSAYIATGIPTAVTPFVHSPAVRCQITMLLESRDIDYWVSIVT